MEIRTLFIIFKGLYNEYKKFVVKEIKKNPTKIITFDEYIYEVLDISDDFDKLIFLGGLALFTSKTCCNIIIDGDLIPEYLCKEAEDKDIRNEFFDFFTNAVLIKYYGIDNGKIESTVRYPLPNGLCDTKINCRIC